MTSFSQYRPPVISQHCQIYLIQYSFHLNKKISFRLIFPYPGKRGRNNRPESEPSNSWENLIFQIQSAYVPRREAWRGAVGGRAWWGGTTPRRQINTAAYLPHTTDPTRLSILLRPDERVYGYVCRADNCSLFATGRAARRKSLANISAPRGSCRCRLLLLAPRSHCCALTTTRTSSRENTK